jgi:hypothetical protein
MHRKTHPDPDIIIKMIDYGANIKDLDTKLKCYGMNVFGCIFRGYLHFYDG